MKAEFKSKWLDALRSGQYRQGQGKLRNEGNEFCCLGVLLDKCIEGYWDIETFFVQPSNEIDQWRYDALDEGNIPSLEIDGELGGFRGYFDISEDEELMLIWMNDGYIGDPPNHMPPIERAEFHVIADWIEANL